MSSITEAGIQLHLPTFRSYPVPDLVKLAQAAQSAGFSQIWVTDNLQIRNPFVVLTALATSVHVKLGTAVMVQYFRNPVDVADTVAAISDLMDGRELSLGISRGNPSTAGLVRIVKPISTLRETARCLHALLAGEEIWIRDYPTLAAYFNLVPEARFRLAFKAQSPVSIYGGGNGPLSIAVGGECMDGIIFGGNYLAAARTGRVRTLLATADEAARKADRSEHLHKVAEIKISVSLDGAAAREFVKTSVAGRILGLREHGYDDDDFLKLGISPFDVDRLQDARGQGVSREGLAAIVTEEMIDALFVAGDPGTCREAMMDVCAMARDHGFQQLMFSQLGPDPTEAVRLLSEEILPVVH